MPKKGKGKKGKGGGLGELESIVAGVEELKTSGEVEQPVEDVPELLDDPETREESETSGMDFLHSAEDTLKESHVSENSEERSQVLGEGEGDKKMSRKELKKLQKKVSDIPQSFCPVLHVQCGCVHVCLWIIGITCKLELIWLEKVRGTNGSRRICFQLLSVSERQDQEFGLLREHDGHNSELRCSEVLHSLLCMELF